MCNPPIYVCKKEIYLLLCCQNLATSTLLAVLKAFCWWWQIFKSVAIKLRLTTLQFLFPLRIPTLQSFVSQCHSHLGEIKTTSTHQFAILKGSIFKQLDSFSILSIDKFSVLKRITLKHLDSFSILSILSRNSQA